MAGLSLASTIWSALHPPTTTYNFDATKNVIANDAMIPIVYGTRKWGGIQTWAFTASDGATQTKDIIISEGNISGVSGITANCLLLTTGDTLFSLQNAVYADATVHVYESGSPTPNDKVLALYANGATTNIALQGLSDIATDQSNDFSCSGLKLMQHIEELGTGWVVTNNAGVDVSPEDIYAVASTPAYKAEVNLCGKGIDNCSYTFSNGGLPDNYETVGSYKNCAWLRAKFKISEKLQGTNPTISAVVKGRLVYDPRSGVTAYSENPALCLRDYVLSKRFGMGRWIKNTDLDEDSWMEVADHCDGLVSYTDAYGHTVTEPRYRLNIILAEKQKNIANIQAILAVFAGFLVFSGDKLSLRVEKQESISYSFDPSNIKKDSVKFDQVDLESSPNRYEITYYDPAQNWVGVKVQVEDSADQHWRGNVINKDVQLQGCIHQGQALRLGRIYKALNRLCPNIVTFSTGTHALHLQPGDVIGFTYGILTNMSMRILSISESKGTWTIKAQQYNLSIYDDALGSQISVSNYVQVPIATLVSANNPMMSGTATINEVTVAVATDVSDALTTAKTYTDSAVSSIVLPDSGITAGTYRSLTVNAKGIAVAGSNPSTVADIGITDVYTKTQVDAKDGTKANSASLVSTGPTILGCSAISGTGALASKQMSFYVDETTNLLYLMYKRSDGVVKSYSLTPYA